jgi:hypothetical protein
MKKFLIGAISALSLGIATVAFADENNSVPLKAGMSFDIGAPSGVALGVLVRPPYIPWWKVGLAITGTLNVGIRANILIDPIKFPIAPVANLDIGHQFPFAIPGVSNSPKVDFTYENIQGGLALGSRDGFRFMLLAGMSHLDGVAHNFQGVLPATNGLVISDPNFSGWVPSAKLGFSLLF